MKILNPIINHILLQQENHGD